MYPLPVFASRLSRRHLGISASQQILFARILKALQKSLTNSFNAFCASQIALHSGSFYCNLMQSTSLQQQLHNVLNGLKSTYLDLVGGKLWASVTAPPRGIANDDEIAQAPAMAAMKNLPWDEWVKKYAKCHHCSEQGHILVLFILTDQVQQNQERRNMHQSLWSTQSLSSRLSCTAT
jgi:hypothetical protein